MGGMYFGALYWADTLGFIRVLIFFKTFFFSLYRVDLSKNGSPRSSLEENKVKSACISSLSCIL